MPDVLGGRKPWATSDPRDTCPNKDLHTPCPRGYVAWQNWAERMTRTHTQRKCKGCGRYSIWVPKRGLGGT